MGRAAAILRGSDPADVSQVSRFATASPYERLVTQRVERCVVRAGWGQLMSQVRVDDLEPKNLFLPARTADPTPRPPSRPSSPPGPRSSTKSPDLAAVQEIGTNPALARLQERSRSCSKITSVDDVTFRIP
jgi:hypothetical protein